LTNKLVEIYTVKVLISSKGGSCNEDFCNRVKCINYSFYFQIADFMERAKLYVIGLAKPRGRKIP